MTSIVPDHDVEGQFRILLSTLQSESWSEIWDALAVGVDTFQELGLDQSAPDSVIWKTCQNNRTVLVTGNRNKESEDSLEATLKREVQANSLPVLTIADPDRVTFDKDYAQRVAVRLLEYLSDLDNLLGTGRLYLP